MRLFNNFACTLGCRGFNKIHQLFLTQHRALCLLALLLSVLAPICEADLSCGSSGKQNFVDFNYCQLSSQMGKPARWIDGVFNGPDNTSIKTSRSEYHITNSTHFVPKEITVNETLFRARWQLPNLEDRLSLRFTSLTDTDSNRENQNSEVALNNKGSSLAAKVKAGFGSAQVGLRYTDNLVLTTQTTIPRSLTIKNNLFGTIQRISWSSDQNWRGFSQFYWDNFLNSTWTSGVDTRLLYQFSTKEGVNLNTYSLIRKSIQWETVIQQGQETLFSDMDHEVNFWSSIAFSRPIRRDWAKIQFIPAVFWRDDNNYQMTTRMTFNMIIKLTN